MNPKAGEVDTNERANGTQASDIEPRNTLLPSKPWIPEKQRLTNREALDILEQKRAERGAKIASGVRVSNLTEEQTESVDLVIKSLKSGVHRVYSDSREEEQALLQAIKQACGDVELEKVSLQDILNYYRPKGQLEGENFFQKEFQEGKISSEVVERIVAVVKERRALKGVDGIEDEDNLEAE